MDCPVLSDVPWDSDSVVASDTVSEDDRVDEENELLECEVEVMLWAGVVETVELWELLDPPLTPAETPWLCDCDVPVDVLSAVPWLWELEALCDSPALAPTLWVDPRLAPAEATPGIPTLPLTCSLIDSPAETPRLLDELCP